MLFSDEKLEFTIDGLMCPKCLVLSMLKRGSDVVDSGLIVI